MAFLIFHQKVQSLLRGSRSWKIGSMVSFLHGLCVPFPFDAFLLGIFLKRPKKAAYWILGSALAAWLASLIHYEIGYFMLCCTQDVVHHRFLHLPLWQTYGPWCLLLTLIPFFPFPGRLVSLFLGMTQGSFGLFCLLVLGTKITKYTGLYLFAHYGSRLCDSLVPWFQNLWEEWKKW